MKLNFYNFITVVLMVLLAGCGGGGGGGDNPPVTSTQSFPLQNGYKANVISGQSVDYNITGACTGTATYTRSPAVNLSTTFEGDPALEVTSASNIVYNPSPCTSNISPDPGPSTTTSYYDYNYTYLGSTETSYYSYMVRPLIPVPLTVRVGDTGVLGRENIDQDSSKFLQLGYTEGSYAVAADTATTTIVTETVKIYRANMGPTPGWYLAATRIEKSRISTNGALTPVSIEIRSETVPGEVIIFTPV